MTAVPKLLVATVKTIQRVRAYEEKIIQRYRHKLDAQNHVLTTRTAGSAAVGHQSSAHVPMSMILY